MPEDSTEERLSALRDLFKRGIISEDELRFLSISIIKGDKDSYLEAQNSDSKFKSRRIRIALIGASLIFLVSIGGFALKKKVESDPKADDVQEQIAIESSQRGERLRLQIKACNDRDDFIKNWWGLEQSWFIWDLHFDNFWPLDANAWNWLDGLSHDFDRLEVSAISIDHPDNHEAKEEFLTQYYVSERHFEEMSSTSSLNDLSSAAFKLFLFFPSLKESSDALEAQLQSTCKAFTD